MERIGNCLVEPITNICEGDILWYAEPAFERGRYANDSRQGENRNQARVKSATKNGKKVVLEIMYSVGHNSKARGATSYKKPSDLFNARTRRAVKAQHGVELFSKTCPGEACSPAKLSIKRKALAERYIRKLRARGDPMIAAMDKDTAREESEHTDPAPATTTQGKT